VSGWDFERTSQCRARRFTKTRSRRQRSKIAALIEQPARRTPTARGREKNSDGHGQDCHRAAKEAENRTPRNRRPRPAHRHALGDAGNRPAVRLVLPRIPSSSSKSRAAATLDISNSRRFAILGSLRRKPSSRGIATRWCRMKSRPRRADRLPKLAAGNRDRAFQSDTISPRDRRAPSIILETKICSGRSAGGKLSTA